MFEGNTVYKLSTLSILPLEITLAQTELAFNDRLTVYKLEVWLGQILLDETYEITTYEQRVHSQVQIMVVASKNFRYFSTELFSRSKVARLRIVFLRGNKEWQQTQIIQTFNIVLSQYSYEYCKNKFNEFREHSVGALKRCFFHYKILCEYEEQKPQKYQDDQNNEFAINIIQHRPDPNSQEDMLAVSPFPEDYEFSQNPSNVFINLMQLKPIFRNQSYDQDKMRIKVEGSVLKAGKSDSQQNSIIKYSQDLKDTAKSASSFVFYLYLILCAVILVIQMSPSKKV